MPITGLVKIIFASYIVHYFLKLLDCVAIHHTGKVTMSVVIPEDILRASQMEEGDLKIEIAMMLYGLGKISSGKVRAWTGLSVIEFQHELAKRNLCLNYGVDDFQQDIETLNSLGLL